MMMSVSVVLVILAFGALPTVWLLLAYHQPPMKRRVSSDYRHQHTENPEYIPPIGGRGGF